MSIRIKRVGWWWYVLDGDCKPGPYYCEADARKAAGLDR